VRAAARPTRQAHMLTSRPWLYEPIPRLAGRERPVNKAMASGCHGAASSGDRTDRGAGHSADTEASKGAVGPDALAMPDPANPWIRQILVEAAARKALTGRSN
jgi:hypothetical protein